MGLAIPWALPLGRPHCRGLTDLPCLRSPWPATGPPLVKQIGDDHRIRIFETTNLKPECWTGLSTTPVSSAMKISASPRNTKDQIILMLQLMFTFVISFQQQKQTWPNPTLFVGFWDLLEVLHIPQSSISTHDATCRALFEIFIPFHPLKKQWGWLLVVSFH